MKAQRADRTAAAALAVLTQCREFLGTLDAGAYTTASPSTFQATIGQHVRHSLDHFSAALSSLGNAIIDYDHRRRETPVERDLSAAIEEIDELCHSLHRVLNSGSDRDVTIRVMLSADGEVETLRSTLARELAFATHHAIHHHAMIASIAAELDCETPAGFGKAPSTANYERTSAHA